MLRRVDSFCDNRHRDPSAGRPDGHLGRCGAPRVRLHQAARCGAALFHATATRLLRLHGRAICLPPSFTILDRGDPEDLMGVLRTELGLAKNDRRFPSRAPAWTIYRPLCERTRAGGAGGEGHFPWCKDEVKTYAAFLGVRRPQRPAERARLRRRPAALLARAP
jgi:hypothetical protein